MKVRFDDNEPEVGGFELIPPGKYVMEIVEVDPDNYTRNGDVMWRLTLQFPIDDEEFGGRKVWDNLVWGGKALNRCRILLKALSLPYKGDVNVEPEDLLNKPLLVTIKTRQYVDSMGETKKINCVDFAGYQAVDKIQDNSDIINQNRQIQRQKQTQLQTQVSLQRALPLQERRLQVRPQQPVRQTGIQKEIEEDFEDIPF